MPDHNAEEDFADLYHAAWGPVVAHAYALTADLGAAQEVAQEALLRAWQRWDRIRDYDDPIAWLIRVAHNVALSRWRRARTAARGLVRMGEPEITREVSADSVAVVAALKQIPEAQRRALVLHHMAGWPVAEVAKVEGVPEGTIKARLSRGRVALAPLLSDALPHDDDGTPPTAKIRADAPADHQPDHLDSWLRRLVAALVWAPEVCRG